jgi:acetyl-CoA C-acetyltransferase
VRDAVIVSAVRTPVGKFQGALKAFLSPQLGALVVRDAVARATIEPKQVDECIMGVVLQAGLGQNPARQAALFGGLRPEVGAFTINQVCGSGLKAVALAALAVETGNAEIAVAGGMESMTNSPYLLRQARNGYRTGDAALVDSMIFDGLWEVYKGVHMGVTAEMIAEKYGITREEQDEFAAESHRRASRATSQGYFHDEILPVKIQSAKRGSTYQIVEADEAIRPETTVEALAALRPVFQDGGTVTAGNSSGVNDGAAALVVMSDQRARDLGIAPLAIIRAQATSGREPEWMGLAPIDAVRKVAAKVGWNLNDVDLFELNEAFSAQALAVNRELNLDPAKVNVDGGAIAIGHPIGASGARVMTTLLHALRRLGRSKGIAGLCLGGGNAVAMAIESVIG